jgi:GrpB-like predicted nucleotidyltransferase (UPF0157 family)
MHQQLSDDLQEFGLHPGELRLIAVGPEWAQRFAQERSRLCAALGPRALDIQHIGSTAVPGLPAKPILDMAVAISDFEAGYVLVPLLLPLGYRYLGENGIPRRHYFVRGTPEAYHLHIFEQRSRDWQRHLHFRDRLLHSRELAQRYAQLKETAVGQCGGNRERYQQMKSSFIAEVQAPGADGATPALHSTSGAHPAADGASSARRE